LRLAARPLRRCRRHGYYAMALPLAEASDTPFSPKRQFRHAIAATPLFSLLAPPDLPLAYLATLSCISDAIAYAIAPPRRFLSADSAAIFAAIFSPLSSPFRAISTPFSPCQMASPASFSFFAHIVFAATRFHAAFFLFIFDID